VEQGKGKKDRQVMLSPETLDLLRAWWKVRTKRDDHGIPAGERWLFPGRRKGLHLTARQVSRLFIETVEAAGLKKKLTLHALRHSFATHLFDRGVDIRTIQALLGHEKLETTARYTRVATGLITAIDSPLDRLSMPHKAKHKRGKDKTPA
jgi:integrase/recombinase XerD